MQRQADEVLHQRRDVQRRELDPRRVVNRAGSPQVEIARLGDVTGLIDEVRLRRQIVAEDDDRKGEDQAGPDPIWPDARTDQGATKV